MKPSKSYLDIQSEVIARYGIKVNEDKCPYGCHSRTHAHVKEREVCKWKAEDNYDATFNLLHEIGHIENNHSRMNRAEQEYHATTWAIDMCREYGLEVKLGTIFIYQRYILLTIYRGARRGGRGYKGLNLYQYIGKDVSYEDVYKKCTPRWQRYMDGYKEHITIN